MATVVMSSPCPSCKSPAASSEDYPDPDRDPDADRSDEDDYFKPLKRLCMMRLNCEGPSSPSPRATIGEEAKEQESPSELDVASKPMAPTPFSIRDILERKPTTTKRIVRPWDLGGDAERPGGGNGGRRRPRSADDDSRSDKSESDCPESPPAGHGHGVGVGVGVVGPAGTSPLDALFEMTSKTFEGLNGGDNSSDSSRDHLHIFSNRQQPKKKRKSRTAFTNHQIFELEKRFLYQKYLSPADRDEIAQSLGLTNAQVITWFQNRRAKLKRDMEELKKDVDAAKGATPPLHKNYMDSIQDLSLMKSEMQSKKHTAVK